jgi:rRNA small subunit pseudouridine methyltransferase Nep1
MPKRVLPTIEASRPKIPKNYEEKAKARRLIVLLEEATLETVRIAGRDELLNSDDHAHYLRKHGRDLSSARPDVTHQCLLMLQDSPLNKSGGLQVYIHTARNVLIEVNPECRIPRTFKRFAALFAQLLTKLTIKSAPAEGDGRGVVLLRVIKNPVQQHIPPNTLVIGTSLTAPKLISMTDYVNELTEKAATRASGDGSSIAIVIGAIAKGHIGNDYLPYEEQVAISQYPLSAALACAKVCSSFETAWDVL